MLGNRKLFLLSIILVTGCSVYTPQPVDIPLINKKKEVRAEFGYCYHEMFFGSVAAGLTNKLAFQTYFNRSYDSRYFFQNAAGYFKDLGNNKVMEVYGGFAFGRTEAGNHDIPTRLKGPYQLYFAQFNYGKIDIHPANIDLGLGLKLGFLHSDLLDYNYFTHIDQPIDMEWLPLVVNNLILEPHVFIRLGGKRLKVNLKAGGCFHYQLDHKDKPLPFIKVSGGIGINYRF